MGYISDIRSYVGHAPLMYPAASVIVINDKNEILLQQRSDNGLWGYCGGGMEPGESPQAAAVRELYEESGLTAEKLELFGVYSGEEQHFFYPNGDEVWTIDILFICREYSGELSAVDGESLKLEFVPMDKISKYPLNPPIKGPLSDFLEKHL